MELENHKPTSSPSSFLPLLHQTLNQKKQKRTTTMNYLNPKPQVLTVITLVFSLHFSTISSSKQPPPPPQHSPSTHQSLNPNPNPNPHPDPNLNLKPPNSSSQIDPQNTSSESDKQQFLTAHNKVRLHFGEPFFVWNDTLALYAAGYAARRSDDCALIHSNGPYGENIFWGSGDQWTSTDVVRLWVHEHHYYDVQTNSCEPGKLCGHYTQIVWRNSVHVGCARVKCKNGDIFAICSYDPPGNYVGERPFDVIN